MPAVRFQALENFFSPETKSEYCRGLRYSILPGNTKLAALVLGWIEQRKVVMVADLTESKVIGKGA